MRIYAGCAYKCVISSNTIRAITRVEVSHLRLNDGVVEGLTALDMPAFSVQFHPEAAAGPHDGEHLFDRFIRLMRSYREERD